MHHIMEYSALVGTGWLFSNVLFVIGWSWLHSPNRRWVSEHGSKPSIFTVHADYAYPNPVGASLGADEMPMNRAS